MGFDPTTPQSSDDPTLTQPRIQSNFTTMNNDFGQNHVPLTSGANKGYHTQLLFPRGLAALPAPTSPESALFPFDINGAVNLLYMNGPTFASMVQLTNLIIANGAVDAMVLPTNPLQITSNNHGLSTGNSITIQGAFGNSALMTALNNVAQTITVLDSNNFTLNGVDGTTFTYSGGALWTTTNPGITRWGIKTPWGLTFNFGSTTISNLGPTTTFAIPYTSKAFMVSTTITTNTALPGAAVTALNLTGFTAVKGGTSAVYYYYSMGV